METLTTLLTTAFPIILTAFMGYIVNRQQKKDLKREEIDAKRDEERKYRDELMQVIVKNQHNMVERLKKIQGRQDEYLEDSERLKECVKMTLQKDLLDSYKEYARNGNRLSDDEYSHWQQTYGAYSAIGGNSFCKKLNGLVEDMEISVSDD